MKKLNIARKKQIKQIIKYSEEWGELEASRQFGVTKSQVKEYVKKKNLLFEIKNEKIRKNLSGAGNSLSKDIQYAQQKTLQLAENYESKNWPFAKSTAMYEISKARKKYMKGKIKEIYDVNGELQVQYMPISFNLNYTYIILPLHYIII